MHMADTLLSPAVGGVMWAGATSAAVYSVKKVKEDFDDRKVPLMGVLGAFIFAAQMLNFAIPGTGSSGHLGGGMLLAILLGPHAGFLTISSVLAVQALFFADGGLIALGANIFNLGFFPCFIAYPLIFKPFTAIGRVKPERSPEGIFKTFGKRIFPASIITSVVGLQLGAFGVVLETVLSGISELPFAKFVMLMQPIHLAIGVVEGVVTAGIVAYILKAKPEVLDGVVQQDSSNALPQRRLNFKNVLIVLGIVTVVCGGLFSWFASKNPDGLEWSISRLTGGGELVERASKAQISASKLQDRFSFLPGYSFAKRGLNAQEVPPREVDLTEPRSAEQTSLQSPVSDEGSLPSVDVGTSLSISGLIGGALTLLISALTGLLIVKRLSGARNRKTGR